MGTKVHCKGYLSGDYSMGNLNEDTSNSWYREDRTLSGHLYNGFMPKPVNGYSEYDKEMLKRTMLEHEAVFRKQVYELHRLYRIQKELMDELKMKELMGMSQSNLFSSQMASEVTEKAWQMSRLATGDTSYTKTSAANTRMGCSLNFLKDNNMHSGPTPSVNGASLKEEMLDSKLTKFPRKMFDLQLPADVYTDNEDAVKAEKENLVNSSCRATNPYNVSGVAEPDNDVKLTLSFGEDPCCRKDSWKSDSHPKNGLSIHRLADLNESIKYISRGGEAGSAATRCLNMRTHYERMQGHRLLSNANHLQMDFFPDAHRNEGTCSSFSTADKEETRQEWSLFHSEVGQSTIDAKSSNPGFYNEKFPMPSKPIQMIHTRANETVLPHQNQMETWFGDKPVQALPCFTGSAASNVQSKSCYVDVQNLSNAAGKQPYNGDLRSNSAHLSPFNFHIPDLDDRGGKSAYENSEDRGKCFNSLRCSDVKPAVDVGLNQGMTNGMRDGFTSHQDVERNHEELSAGLSWLGTKPALGGSADVKKSVFQMESSFSGGYSQLMCTMAQEVRKKQEKGKGPSSLWTLQDFSSSLQIKESRKWRNEASDSLNGEKIFGFPILEKVQQSPVCSLSTNDTRCSENQGLHPDFSHDVKVPSLEKQVHVATLVRGRDFGNSSKDLRNHINLNLVVSCMDIPNSSENSPAGEAKVPSTLSILIAGGKITREIDLEAPIAALADESMNSQEEVARMNHLAAPFQIALNETDGRQETECTYRTLIMVAENLIAMSLDMGSHLDGPLTPTSFDSLNWFAEFVSSNAQSVSKEGGYDAAEMLVDDGLDHFESMTLKLKAMKPEEYWCRPQYLDNQEDGETGTASLLLTKLRRGQGRKRRQKRDFQKDILPGLVSLSRQEVIEDLQAFGGLMRASGRSSTASLARRNTNRNGFSCRGRGRGRPRSLAVTIAEVHVNPTPTQPTLTELEPDERTVVGWGRTRRCRRQRVPSGNASALLT